jgi:hypothetical protein
MTQTTQAQVKSASILVTDTSLSLLFTRATVPAVGEAVRKNGSNFLFKVVGTWNDFKNKIQQCTDFALTSDIAIK